MESTLYEKLLNAAFRFVSYRPHSKKEIREFLEKKLKSWKTVGEFSVEKVMNRLVEYGHVDDRKFASWWVVQRSSFRPKGKRALIAELTQRGVSREITASVFAEGATREDSFDELSLARKVIHKKAVTWGHLPRIEQKKKLYMFLTARGFSSETVSKIIDETVKKDYNT